MRNPQPDTVTITAGTRRCVACGFVGPELDNPQTVHSCPGCGCDFQQRPPRSYAEMEGLVPASGIDTADPIFYWREMIERQHLAAAQRWLTGAFLAVLGLVAMLFVLVLVVTAE